MQRLPLRAADRDALIAAYGNGGEGGIRTLGTLLTYTHFPGVLLQPLGHLSGKNAGLLPGKTARKGKLVARVTQSHPVVHAAPDPSYPRIKR